jgi:hypothetical protein
MISSYRLGDLVLLELNQVEIDEILTEHPDTIASRFITEKRNNNPENNPNTNLDIITKIVVEYIEKYSAHLPQNVSESTVIHLRIGDVVGGNEEHEIIKRPLTVEHIQTLVENDTNPKYVIGKCFFARPSSTNYEECIQLSNEYLQNVITELQAVHFNSGNADIDFCFAVKSKRFIQGRGFYSRLIVEVRKRLQLFDNMETRISTGHW